MIMYSSSKSYSGGRGIEQHTYMIYIDLLT